MVKIFVFIKHNLRPIWKVIESANGLLFRFLYYSRLKAVLPEILENNQSTPYCFKVLDSSQDELLKDLIDRQNPADLEFFSPHAFDLYSIKKQFNNNAFLMMGVFAESNLVGYFFLRFFANKKCFVGRIIDQDYRGMSIGKTMNRIMYETAWSINFRCLSTISKNNSLVMRAHISNSNILIIKELRNEYLLVEFVK